MTNRIKCGKLKKLRDEERKPGARPSQLEKLRKETKKVVKYTYNSTENHRLYVFVDDGNTKRPHFVELLISNDGTRAVFYQSK